MNRTKQDLERVDSITIISDQNLEQSQVSTLSKENQPKVVVHNQIYVPHTHFQKELVPSKWSWHLPTPFKSVKESILQLPTPSLVSFEHLCYKM